MTRDSGRAHEDTSRPPRHCPTCGHDLSEHPYYQLRPSPFAAKLLTIARWLLPVMAVVFLIQLYSGNFLLILSVASGYLIVAYICAPSLLLYVITLPIPRTRRVICLHCSWFHDYPWRRGLFEARSTETPSFPNV